MTTNDPFALSSSSEDDRTAGLSEDAVDMITQVQDELSAAREEIVKLKKALASKKAPTKPATKAPQLAVADLPFSATDTQDVRFNWTANVVRVRGRGRIGVHVLPTGWTGDAPLTIDLREVQAVHDLLGTVLSVTEDLRASA